MRKSLAFRGAIVIHNPDEMQGAYFARVTRTSAKDAFMLYALKQLQVEGSALTVAAVSWYAGVERETVLDFLLDAHTSGLLEFRGIKDGSKVFEATPVFEHAFAYCHHGLKANIPFRAGIDYRA